MAAPDRQDRQVTAGDCECKADQPSLLSVSVSDGWSEQIFQISK